MPNHFLGGIIALCLMSSFSGWALDVNYRNNLSKNLGVVTQNFLVLNALANSDRTKFQFPNYTKQELDQFLKSEFGGVYDGYHILIEEYVKFWISRPMNQLQTWYTLDQHFKNSLPAEDFRGKPISVLTHQLLRSRLNYSNLHNNSDVLLPYPISLVYGNVKDEFLDLRWSQQRNFSMHLSYFIALLSRFDRSSHAIAAAVVGPATLTRITNFSAKTYWEIYAEIDHESRDFYPAMLASAFVFNQMEKHGMKPLSLKSTNSWVETSSQFSLTIDAFKTLSRSNYNAFSLKNQGYYQRIIPQGSSFYLPNSLLESFKEIEQDIAIASAYAIHKIKSPNCLVIYNRKSEEPIGQTAKNFNSDLNYLLKINCLGRNEACNKKLLFIVVPEKDSLFYAAFDSLTLEDIQLQIKQKGELPQPQVEQLDQPKPNNPPSKTYIVKSGDTLSAIARKHGVSVNQIKAWNNLRSDNIQIGQKLIVKK